MSKVFSVRVPDDFAEWADGYAAARGVSRQEFLATALESFRGDCEGGVPEIQSSVRPKGKPGECVCPVFEDGARGYRQRCPVHGFGDASLEERRAHFAAATAERADLFSKLRSPDSTRGLRKPGTPPREEK